MSRKDSEAKAREAIRSILEEQLSNPETPEVKQQYNRLRSQGYSDAETREMMSVILLIYINETAAGNDYGYADYVAGLRYLPEIDWGDEE
ncbi:MAG: hypothetical protein QM796_01685 [Chthoniobacteraceae bacterium]